MEKGACILSQCLLCLLLSFDNYEMFPNKHSYSSYWWRKDPNFRKEFRIVRLLTEVCPYWFQVMLALALSIERYILICKSTSAKTLLTAKTRLVFYGAVSVTGLLLPSLITFHYVLTGLDRVRVKKLGTKAPILRSLTKTKFV